MTCLDSGEGILHDSSARGFNCELPRRRKKDGGLRLAWQPESFGVTSVDNGVEKIRDACRCQKHVGVTAR